MVIHYFHAPKFHHQAPAGHLGIGSGSAEDNRRPFAMSGKLDDRLHAAETPVCAVDYIGPVGIGPDNQGSGEEEAGADVADGLFGCGCGESQDLVGTKADDDIGKRTVGRAETLAPLGDHVGFIYHQKTYGSFAQLVQDLTVLQGLRGGDDYLYAVFQFPEQLLAPFMRLSPAKADAVHSRFLQTMDLVVHQGQKGVDDDRDTSAKHCRQEEAQRLACSRGENDYLVPDDIAVLLFENPVYDKDLVGFEGPDSEAGGGCGDYGGHVICLHTPYNGKTAVFIEDSGFKSEEKKKKV